MKAIKRRISWVPETVDLVRVKGPPLRYELALRTDPAGTAEIVALLDRLDGPADASRRAAAKQLRDAGEKVRNEVLSAALRRRRNRPTAAGTTPGTTFTATPGTTPGTTGREP